MTDIAQSCPNCESENLLFKNGNLIEHWIHCDTCGQDGPVMGSRTQAIEAWNEMPIVMEVVSQEIDQGGNIAMVEKTLVCCGSPRDGKFCGECGKALTPSSCLWNLVDHCKRSAQATRTTAATRIRRHRAWAENHPSVNAGDLEKRIAKINKQSERTSAKWDQMAVALEELLSRS